MGAYSIATMAFLFSVFIAGASVKADDQPSPPPQSRSQMQMDRDTTNPKANVVGVKPIPGGPQTGHGGLDPNANGSSAGLGIQIPLGGSGNDAKKGAAALDQDKNQEKSKGPDERDSE